MQIVQDKLYFYSSAIKTKIINRFIKFRCKNVGKLMSKNNFKKTSCLRASKSTYRNERDGNQ